jgi:hypothetical protein
MERSILCNIGETGKKAPPSSNNGWTKHSPESQALHHVQSAAEATARRNIQSAAPVLHKNVIGENAWLRPPPGPIR